MVRRYAWFALLLPLGCSGTDNAPQQTATQEAETQAPQTAPPQQQTPPATAQPQQPVQMPKPDASMATAAAAAAAAAAGEPATPPAGARDAGAMRVPDAATPPTTTPPAAAACDARKVDGPSGVFFHHIHFNTTDPDADLAFYEKYFEAMPIDFCTKPGGAPPTRATRTERGYFLFSRVDTKPDPTLNAYLEHIGWCHQDPAGELQRLVALGAPLWPSDPGRGQCETAAAGTQPCNDYWFYLQSPSGAKVEVALGPGPATMGFGHVHVIMGEDLTWYEKITGGRYANTAIDVVNITDVLEDEAYLDGQMVTDTKGKPIDHIGFSTSSLEAERDRIKAAGIEIAEDISFKQEYGFRSFFVKSAKGIWVEMVEDSAFAP
jgi:catechol 2,3-dioxygenase-like lactoylglutathione lyase family enzyme